MQAGALQPLTISSATAAECRGLQPRPHTGGGTALVLSQHAEADCCIATFQGKLMEVIRLQMSRGNSCNAWWAFLLQRAIMAYILF